MNTAVPGDLRRNYSLHSSTMILVIFMTLFLPMVFTCHQHCEQQCKPKSCEDIYREDRRNPSGEYVIYQEDQAIKVYCSFQGDYGYTYISRQFSGVSIDLDSLYSTNEFAKVRILKSNGEQREVIVENLSTYKKLSSLSFTYNSHPNYQGPRPHNRGLHPYLFLGFLPIRLVKNKNTQGYRAAGKDFTFRNCDANPNSYLTFFFNPRNQRPGNVGWTNTLMTQWITHSTPLQYPDYMDSSFYMDWEMHMGGCGGLTTSKVVSNDKAALGLPFEMKKSETPQEIGRICAAVKPPHLTFFASQKRYQFILCDEYGKGLLMKCRLGTVWCQGKRACAEKC